MTPGQDRWRGTHGAALALALYPAALGLAGELQVVSISPAANAIAAPASSAIEVHFDQPVLRSSITSASFWAFARWSGVVEGELIFTEFDQKVSLVPRGSFSAGEVVTVYLSHDVRGADGSPLRSAGYSWQFRVRAGAAGLEYELLVSMTTRTNPNVGVRSYGGIGSDLNHDGWLDLTVVNEDSQDLRVFLNLADASGLYQPFLQPTFPVGDRASPSEPCDFNRDGHVDICVANIDVATVSVLLGNGDGTFGPQQLIAVGNAPRGICTLDADGDGDADIVNTNASSANLSIMLNDGAGVFGPPTFFQGGAANEWALAAADMTSDGILDLVIGGRVDQKVFIRAGNGDGTFSAAGSQSCGGLVWMIDVGDLDGDGDADVACANSNTNNGAILRGDGAGNLAPAQTYPTDAFPLATDLGDLDGDGDLDWEMSSFNGDWRLFTNDGSGTYAFNQEFNAPAAASCAVMLDFDNDSDLDLALIDEIADVVVLQKNLSPAPAPAPGRHRRSRWRRRRGRRGPRPAAPALGPQGPDHRRPRCQRPRGWRRPRHPAAQLDRVREGDHARAMRH